MLGIDCQQILPASLHFHLIFHITAVNLNIMELLNKEEFTKRVLSRDNRKCVICTYSPAEPFHILEERLWPDNDYYLENGASLCNKHKQEAEMTLLSCDEIRKAAGIKITALPPWFDPEHRYDRWGNVILPNKMRVKGELFYDDYVQNLLKKAEVLDQFTKYVKFPKILHLPWSEGVDSKTDRVFYNKEINEAFTGREIIVTEKLDGENISMYRDYIHARSINSRNHPSRNWVKNLHSKIAHRIPVNWRICGENLFATHSIHYKGLPSYFVVFGVYNDKNECLPWEEIIKLTKELSLPAAPLIYTGTFNEAAIKACYTGKSAFGDSIQEGYVIRLADKIPWRSHRLSFAKFVRSRHVRTNKEWRHKQIQKNEMSK